MKKATSRVLIVLTALILLAPHARLSEAKNDPKLDEYNKAAAECLEKGHQALAQRHVAEAAKEFKACAEKHPNSTAAQYWLASSYFLGKDAENAIVGFKRVLEIDPENIDAIAMLGKIYSFDKTKLSLAQELLERSIKARPESTDFRFDLARVYCQLGQIQKCFGEFSFLLDSETKFAIYRTELAKIMLAGDAKDQAKKMLERAIVLDPSFQPAKDLLQQIESGAAGPKK